MPDLLMGHFAYTVPKAAVYTDPVIFTERTIPMSEPVTLYQRPERLTVAKIRRPLSKAAENLLAKATEMVECHEARDVDDAIDTLRLANDPDYLTAAAETDHTVVIKKAAPEPSTFETLCAYAKRMVDLGQARNVPDAVEALGKVRHPAYVAWREEGKTPLSMTSTTTGDDVTSVVKAAEAAKLAKRLAVRTEINKLAAPLIQGGMTEAAAWQAVWKADYERGGDLYDRYRKSSYADGPLADVPHEGPRAAPPGPAYQAAERQALEMKQNDPWGEHAGKSKQDLIEKVWEANPQLYRQYREESYDRLRKT